MSSWERGWGQRGGQGGGTWGQAEKDLECQVKVWDFILRQCEVLEGFEEKEERAQTPGSSPWLCLPLFGTLCPSQPD